ncbi:MAG: rhodanese-like domain-containing protein [Fibrobacterota bacterium]
MKTHLIRAAIVLAASLFLALGINAARPDGVPLIRPSKEALALRAGITPIQLDTAKLLLEDPKVLFVDARPRNVWKRGRIPGAINFPEEVSDSLMQGFRDTVALDRPLVVYCDGEECRSSDLLSKKLSQVGYKYVYLFFGGWVQWRDAGERTEK